MADKPTMRDVWAVFHDPEVGLGVKFMEADALRNMAMCEIDDAILDRGYLPDWEETWVDSYDSSIEFGGVPDDAVLSPEAVQWLWDIGFQRCWLNHKDGGETYYWKGGDAAGSQSKRRAKCSA